jgi:hypothetical protein
VANQLAVTFLFWCMTNATTGEPRPLYIDILLQMLKLLERDNCSV